MAISCSDIKSPSTHNAKALLDAVALMENTDVVCVIDDLNDQHQTNYRLSDYRMNRQLPIPLKSVLRTRYRNRALEQSQIIEIIDKKTQRIPVISGALLLLLGAILLL